ncbi:nudC domain-containing protein 1 isoform X2 [Rhynchophorus ferrugineus]|uniref:nudC domain-containing protein 1 isoform X2 n=1 Tax=Rhynchophorus ferrugineus TaxID=354439 RepID=UPI003FCC2B98
MSSTVLELKPDRLLLDSNFDGYRLSLEEIRISRKELQAPVEKILLNSTQYSFLHAKLFGLHNHLFADRYDDFNSVYFVDKNRNVQKTYVDTLTNELVAPVTVFNVPPCREPQSGDYNVTLHFANLTYAVLSDGMGMLYILETRDKKDDDYFESVFSTKPLDIDDQGFIITDSLYHEERGELHVLLLHIQDDTVDHFVSVIHWLTFKRMREDSIWGQTALRRLKIKGEVQYLKLEQNCNNIYIVSDNEVRFEVNSEHPIRQRTTDPRKVYSWYQSIDDITVKFKLPAEVEKDLIIVATESNHITVQYETQVLLTGKLFKTIDSNLTVWTLTGDVLEVVLNKSENSYWSDLVETDKGGEHVLDSYAITTANDILGNYSTDRDAVPQGGAVFNSQQIEECDYEQEKSETFRRISGIVNTTTHKAYLGSYNIVLSPYLATNQSPAMGIRHDVDVCLWQPSVENDDFTIKHQGTLLAFGYVQVDGFKTEQKIYHVLAQFRICSNQRIFGTYFHIPPKQARFFH